MKNSYRVLGWVLLILLFIPGAAEASPKVANYFLGSFDTGNYSELARYDLLILTPEAVYYNRPFFEYYRYRRPRGKLLAYLYPSQFYLNSLWYDNFGVRTRIFKNIITNDWWLRDADGDVVQSWPGMNVVNLTDKDWQEYALGEYRDVYDLELWDGVMYDMVDSRASLYNKDGIDIDDDGLAEPDDTVDWFWQNAMADLLNRTGDALAGDKAIVINGNNLYTYQDPVNGRIFESFPTPWESGGSWSASMYQYLRRLPMLNRRPAIHILNTAYNPDDSRSYFEQMRFGLASAMLGDGYHSFDAGPESHAEMWWFDEYEYDLGMPESRAYMPFKPDGFADGLWRRDYEKGVVLVNSGSNALEYDLGGEYQKIKGVQQPAVNNGQLVKSVCLGPKQGLLLLDKDYEQPLLFGDYLTSYSLDQKAEAKWWQNFNWLKALFAWFCQVFVQIVNLSVEFVVRILFYFSLFLKFMFPLVI